VLNGPLFCIVFSDPILLLYHKRTPGFTLFGYCGGLSVLKRVACVCVIDGAIRISSLRHDEMGGGGGGAVVNTVMNLRTP